MKPIQIQRQTKKRKTGLRASEFLFRHFSADKKQSDRLEAFNTIETFWPIKDLLKESLQEEHAANLLSLLLKTLFFSPSAARMISEAQSHGWSLGLEDLGERDFHIDVPEKRLTLHDQGLGAQGIKRSDYFQNIELISLIRGLRDIWQEIRHGGFDEEYAPEHILLLERVRAADCDVVSVLVAWELRTENMGGLWRHLIGSEEGDMAMAFSASLERAGASQFDGKALSAAFSQWFRDTARVNACDHETLCYMDEILREYPVGNPFGKRKPTNIGVEILSCLPDKTPYLRGMGQHILSHPLYCGLNDDINQAHFFQIIQDTKVTYVEGVPFSDPLLAEKIFPESFFVLKQESTHS